ncbi:MAG: penicillin-binding protein 1A [Gammaproteobacteria bacterium]
MLVKLLKWFSIIFVIFLLAGTVAGYLIIDELSDDLPDIGTLKDVHYQIPLKIFSHDGYLIAEFGEKKRTPVTIAEVPDPLIKAFLAAEDDRFFDHPGVDYRGILRAAWQLALTGKKKQGGSTITMQVTRNFLLSREKTYTRKIKEIILALKIEQAYSKDKIIELYLNKIYLGHRSYGVAAAAQTYYGKTLHELSLAQCAMIAGLPKAPSTFNPITNVNRALERRNYILNRMHTLGYIDDQALRNAVSEPATAKIQRHAIEISAPFIAEMVRQKVIEQYGEEAYNSGMIVHTTITRPLQTTAIRALRNTLHQYDERHGYRYSEQAKMGQISDFKKLPTIGNSLPGIVNSLEQSGAKVRLQNEKVIEIPWDNIKWARKFISRNALGPKPERIDKVIKMGDIIHVRQLNDQSWALAQVPEVEGAFVAINPADGAILALTGGYDFFNNKFNRATQSIRQPGSGFKPIIYTTALENGYTAASMINDAPIVIDDPSLESEWRPENYSRKFYGPTSLRTALRKSRNLISIRLLRQLGIDKVTATAMRFGFTQEQLPKSLTLALGSGQATPLQMSRVFSVFANGGFLVKPYFIDSIESSEGHVLFKADSARACDTCTEDIPVMPEQAPRIISPQVNFIMNSLLRDVVQRGTATRANVLGRHDLAGKTGTTNDQRDAWFNGFAPGIAATAWVGFDDFSPLGNRETGGTAALPMWIEFMQEALKDTPEIPLTPPPGIEKLWIDTDTGALASTGSASGYWEYFDTKTLPQQSRGNTPHPNAPARTLNTDKKPVETLF